MSSYAKWTLNAGLLEKRLNTLAIFERTVAIFSDTALVFFIG